MAKPTIADVARVAGVSKGLVSFALNDRPGVAPATRDRILAAAGQLGWRPSIAGRSLTNRQAYAVGLVISRDPEVVSADPFFPAFIAGVERSLVGADRALVLSIVPADQEEAVYRRWVGDRRVDGFFLSDLRTDDHRLALLAELDVPAVTLGRTASADRFPAVAVDDTAGVTEAVQHLLAHGHRRVAHVAGPSSFVHAVRRRTAFTEALAEVGLEPAQVVETDFSAEQAAAATATLLDAAPEERPTAIVYGNDLSAIAGLGVAQAAGLRVPDDLSIVGFDDAAIAQHVHPSLTSVRTFPMEWGERAAHALLDLIAGDEVAAIDVAPSRLVVRASSGRAPAEPAGPPAP